MVKEIRFGRALVKIYILSHSFTVEIGFDPQI
jgi:hypothetical protein